MVLFQVLLVAPSVALAADTTTPQIWGLSLRSPGPFNTNDAVVIDFTTFDHESDVSLVTFFYEGPGTVERQTSNSNPNPTWAVLQTGMEWSTGTYSLERIVVQDAAYNISDYRRDGTIFKYPGTAVGPTSHVLDFGVLDFYLNNPAYDTIIPTLESIVRRETGPFAPGEIVHFDLDSFDASQVTNVIAQFAFPTGGSFQVATNQVYGTTIELGIGGTWPTGSYTLERVSILDGAGNGADYLPDGTIAKYRLDAIGPDTHDLDLDQLSFVVEIPTLSIKDVRVNEDDGVATFYVRMSQLMSRPVWVNYATSFGTASAPADYSFVGGQLKFEANELVKTIAVPITDDLLDERNEAFFVNLSTPTNALLGDGQAVGSIFDNDPAPNMSIDDVRVNEGDLVATFTVRLSGPSTQQVTVGVATYRGTARSPRDYTAVAGTLIFNAGEVTRTLSVSIVDDARSERTEKFFVNLSNATNADLVDLYGMAKIIDND